MLFNSFEFIFIFLPLNIFFLILLGKFRRAQVSFVVVCSIFFYGYWNFNYLALLGASVLFNWVLARLIDRFRSRSRLLVCAGVVVNLLLLGYFKYASFLIESVNELGGAFIVPEIVLPLAISFFTFQQIAFLIDVHKRKIEKFRFLEYVFFVTFFPQLIAGPIVNFKDFSPQLASFGFDRKKFSFGFSLFILGLMKKVMVADSFSPIVNHGYDNFHSLNAFTAWCTSFAYTFQLYFDFSGYADMAVGLGLFFGVSLPKNFNSPYKSSNIQDFWGRWHITLGAWFKEYLYIPLGGNKKGFSRTLLNLFVVAFLSGVWHGAGYTFVVWGLLHGFALVTHRIWVCYSPLRLNRHLGILVTFLFVNFAWVFFRAPSLDVAFSIIDTMIKSPWGEIRIPLNWKMYLGFIILFGFISLNFKNSIQYKYHSGKISYALLNGSILFWGVALLSRVSEFIYFRF